MLLGISGSASAENWAGDVEEADDELDVVVVGEFAMLPEDGEVDVLSVTDFPDVSTGFGFTGAGAGVGIDVSGIGSTLSVLSVRGPDMLVFSGWDVAIRAAGSFTAYGMLK
jgi:hypothetical protein